MAGPHAGRRDLAPIDALLDHLWTVSPRSDRIGLRLEGPLAPGDRDRQGAGADRVDAGELVSIPMLPGAIEVPPDGRPIVLLVDAPTVGGYPVPLVVIAADLPVLGQLRPGDELRFDLVDAETARRRAARAAEELALAARLLAST
jgi:antagonist of KipI